MRTQTLLIMVMAALLTTTRAAPAGAARCGEVFIRSNSEMQVRIKELAELYLFANGQSSSAVTTLSSEKFNSRLADISDRFGRGETQKLLRQAIKDIRRKKSAEIAEEQARHKKERKTLGPVKVQPKFVDRISAMSVNSLTDSLGLPDGSKLIETFDSNKIQRLTLFGEPPYFKTETIKFPDRDQKDPVLPTRWDFRETGAGWIGIGKEAGNEPTKDVWFWKVSKGGKAIKSLPRPEPKGQRSGRNSQVRLDALSPNGQFAISADDNGTIHRVDLTNGKKTATTVPIAYLVGAWVRDNGSIIAWTRQGMQWEFDSSLKPKLLKSFQQLYDRNGPGLVQVSASPNHEQIVFMTNEGSALLVDLKKRKSIHHPLGNFSGNEVTWRENTVWVESDHVMYPLPRDLRKAPNFTVPKDAVRESKGRRFHARVWTEMTSETEIDYLSIVDLENGKITSLDWRDLSRDWGGNYSTTWGKHEPVVSRNGALLAVNTPGGRYGDVVFFDLIGKKVAGGLKLTSSQERIADPPHWGPNDETLVFEVHDQAKREYELQIWRLDSEDGDS